MKYLIFLSLIFSLNSFAEGEPTFNKDQIDLKVNVYKNLEEMQRELLNRGIPFDKFANGLAYYAVSDNICEIFIVKHKKEQKTQTLLGHELMHCMYGDYH